MNTKIKTVFMALLKAVLYTLFFLCVQLTVGFVVGIAIALGDAVMMAADGIMDAAAIVDSLTAKLMAQTGVITVISSIITVLGLWGFFAMRGKRFFGEISPKPLGARYIWPLIVGAIGLAGFVGIALDVLPIPESIMSEYIEASADVGALTFSGIISTVLLAPIAEEVVFRGLVYTRLRRAMPASAAMLLSSLMFGVLHGQIVWIVYAAFLGVIMAAVFERTGSLHSSIILHVVFNLMGGYIMPSVPPEIQYIGLLASLALISLGVFGLMRKRPAE